MRYTWLDSYLLAKPAVTKDLQPDWNWIRYQIGGKLFAAVLLGEDDVPVYINLKLPPEEGRFFRAQYPGDVIPGYYSNKEHWNSVKPDGSVPDDLLREWLDASYRLVLESLPKSKQRDVLGISVCGTHCASCGLYGKKCPGCNAVKGKVFHAPAGKPCPIFACCVHRKKLAHCGQCPDMPCTLWRTTRDPALSDEAFEEIFSRRAENLRF